MRRTENGKQFEHDHPYGFEKLTKAMELTRGNVNNSFAQKIAQQPLSTVDDIVRLGIGEEEWSSQKIWDTDEYRGKNQKKGQAREKFRYCLRDTFAYRFMDKLGMAEEVIAKNNLYKYADDKVILVDTVHYDIEHNPANRNDNKTFKKKVRNYAISAFFDEFLTIASIPKEMRDKVISDKFILELWIGTTKETDRLPYWKALPTGYSDKQREAAEQEYSEKQREKKAKEVLMMSEAPEDVIERLKGVIADNKRKKEEAKAKARFWHTSDDYRFVPFADVWYNNQRLQAWKLERELEIEDFYKALDLMGLGIVCMDRANHNRQKNIRQFVTHVNSITRRFASDIKKGFDPADVRELIKEDLNKWLHERVEDKWEVYIRKDAPKTYPQYQSGKKKKIVVENESLLFQAIVKKIDEKLGEED